MKSMTGFGRAVCHLADKKINIEIKSVNSKQLEISFRLPQLLRDKESEIRNLISEKLERGKIDVFITIDYLQNGGNYSLNIQQAKKYLEEIKNLVFELKLSEPTDITALLLRLPDVIETPHEVVETEEWNLILQAIHTAIQHLDDFRTSEGNALKDDMIYRISLIEQGIKNIEPFETIRIENIKQKLQKNLYNVIMPESVDNNRFEQELIYYLEKMDFTEEKVRLQKHCDYFKETANELHSNGRKLSFICQEIGRELNTLGAKANDYNIQKIVVEMKNELEKIKEQVLNVL